MFKEMTVLIVEDEKLAADRLIQLLYKIDASIIVLDTVETVAETIGWLQTNPPPDLILLDIQLNDGISFEIFSAIKVLTPVIFTTAYDKYAIRAFKVNSIDYLLKPVDLEALTFAITKLRSLALPFAAPNSPLNEKINRLHDEFFKGHKTRFLVKSGSVYNSVPIEDIIAFYVKDHSVFLRTVTGKIFSLDYSLQEIETMVSPKHFFRINRTHLVSIPSIVQMVGRSDHKLKIKLKNNGDEEISVSREKIQKFKEWLGK
jgi:DNA-binding LytR/AlgR family response regulator